MDLAPGPNVDVILHHPYRWREVASESVDVLISGQVLEHVEFFWITMLEISRVLKPGGLACIIVPSRGPEHRYPFDCWRFYPDGMRTLANTARLITERVSTQWEGSSDPGSDLWRDSVLVARKPVRRWINRQGVRLLQALQREVLLAGLVSSANKNGP
jgi:SAM-dependent methyltransferase